MEGIKMGKNKLAAMVLTGLMAAAPLTSVQASNSWEWAVTPYLWMPTISMDADTNVPPGGVGTDTSFDDVLDAIQGGFLFHVEGQGEHFGMFGDVMYISLGKDQEFTNFDLETDLDSSIWELAAVWNVDPERFEGLEVIAGWRYFDVGLEMAFDPVNPALANVELDAGKNYSDFMLGLRYIGNSGGKWGYVLRADGSWGGTEGTYNLAGNITYKTDNGAWAFGYRHLNTTLEADNNLANATPGDNVDVDLTLSGPIVSYTWFFK
jgi:hypothetical protein